MRREIESEEKYLEKEGEEEEMEERNNAMKELSMARTDWDSKGFLAACNQR